MMETTRYAVEVFSDTWQAPGDEDAAEFEHYEDALACIDDLRAMERPGDGWEGAEYRIVELTYWAHDGLSGCEVAS